MELAFQTMLQSAPLASRGNALQHPCRRCTSVREGCIHNKYAAIDSRDKLVRLLSQQNPVKPVSENEGALNIGHTASLAHL